jgi:tetratricopeptide (TPR) repeat protein
MNACAAGTFAEEFGERGLHEAELACWECAIRLDPSESCYVNNRLSALSRLGRYEEQLSGLEEAATRFPDSYLISSNRVHALLNLGRMDEAAAFGREVIQKWPEQAGVINNLSWFFLLDGAKERVDQAEALLARTDQLQVSNQVAGPLRGTKSLLRLRRGKYAEGLEEIRALIAEELSEWGPRFPKFIPAPVRRNHGSHRLMESMFLEALGRTQEARAALHEGLKYNPDPKVVELARSMSNTARA